MGAFKGVSGWLKKPITDVAQSLGYSGDNILVLQGDDERLRREYPETYNNMCSCRHHADWRLPIEYGQDLVASWIIEDLFLKGLQTSKEFSVQLDGADKNRKILPNTKTQAVSDYVVVSPEGQRVKCELMCDYTGFWARTGKLHLRDEKYKQLVDSQSLMLAVSITTNEFALYDFRKNVDAVFISNHRPYGFKPAYELKISSNMMKKFTTPVVVSAISEIL